jgi:hypothetical protein
MHKVTLFLLFWWPISSAVSAETLSLRRHPTLDLVGGRSDKNSVGHGRNVALYTGSPSHFFFATHDLGNVFSAVDGATVVWYPDHVVVAGSNSLGVIREQRQVCVTHEDVVVSRIFLTNLFSEAVTHSIVVTGDCRKSADWREKPGGRKITEREGDFVIINDGNVVFLKNGLSMAIGGTLPPATIVTDPPGAYTATWNVDVPAHAARELTLACAFASERRRALRNLKDALFDSKVLDDNRADWARFFDREVPRFRCSDRGLEELYAFRWFLLRFSTAGGDLGYFKYPVVLEGRQAYQTYCCYSAPFMAYDLNWATDPKIGYGHIANMAEAAYEDGRFPWYTSPRTNRVMVHHESRTGLSLLPHAAWKYYLVHGDQGAVRRLYPCMKQNVLWWIRDRDADGDGIFQIAHQYETGMDDLHRWGPKSMTWRYDAVDATTYALLNIEAVRNMARVLKEDNDARFFQDYADKCAAAFGSKLWHAPSHSWRDRHPETRELADVLSITTFYPLLTSAPGEPQLAALREHLLNREEFWLPYPVPALAKNQRDFNPNGFWQGPSWPAATTHVIEAFATTAKTRDRALLPQAAELFRRAALMHLQPRADFYERYNPITGKPLSGFRDYMHSWWIDLYVRHVVGLMIADDRSVSIDALPLGLDHFVLEGALCRGQKIDVLWSRPGKENWGKTAGLQVRLNGKRLLHKPDYQPGDAPIVILPP